MRRVNGTHGEPGGLEQEASLSREAEEVEGIGTKEHGRLMSDYLLLNPVSMYDELLRLVPRSINRPSSEFGCNT